VLDLKSDLTDNETAGDLEDLNARLEEAFGDSLYTRDEFDVTGAWPDTADLRNRVICVLSGNSNNRASYRYCTGAQPALAMQDDGAVVVAYRSSAGDMRYWSGRARLARGDAPGRIELDPQGHVRVEPAHRSPSRPSHGHGRRLVRVSSTASAPRRGGRAVHPARHDRRAGRRPAASSGATATRSAAASCPAWRW
jgi:hypothetical protein